MGLNAVERRRLTELAEQLAIEDPRLGRELTAPRWWRWVPRSRRAFRWLSVLLFAAGLATAVVGVVIQQPQMFALGGMVTIAAPMMFVASFGRHRR